jgi:predicted ATP-grasp superfamily ATP-dependent carboligase
MMRVLVFEYITGGGCNQAALPSSLAREGCLMLQALLADFSALPAIELTVMLDSRLLAEVDTRAVQHLAIISPEQDTEAEFVRLLAAADAVWPIAPESDGVLLRLCLAVQAQGKRLLTSPAAAVAVTGDKYQAYRRLQQHGIATVATQLADQAMFAPGEWLIKPIDGAGCGGTYILPTQAALAKHIIRSPRFIIQPHLHGEKTSLSCLFRHGESWLLSVNLQGFTVCDHQYVLQDIIVNDRPVTSAYQQVAAQVAKACPELWGYVGIDLIETPETIWVLEINPRLTSSFAALRSALGINVAELVLQLLHGPPAITVSTDQAITLTLHS